ncbi:ABC transporter substrate-binding protein [Haladaptatus sp. DJG-WS-42]|uniref:ABC transporter substrate-binding protein n=1 Tax=Haladaptatus sp. DJG-WS-42 TaxID=3120516 RepID=UPI0030CC1E3B
MSDALFPANPTAEPRVVSTSPSGTEICYALGIEPVAVSHACDFPEAVGSVPVIDRSRVTGESSAARHDSVATARREGGVYELDVELLEACTPDLILSQSVCGVCAVDEAFVRDTLDDSVATVLGLSASTLSDVFECVAQVGAATGTEARAIEVVGQCQRRLAEIAASAPDDRPRVAVIEWMEPLHVAANWVPEIVEAAGGTYGLADPGDRSVTVDWAEIREYNPDVLIVAPCSFEPAETRARLSELTSRPGWESLSAVQADRVHVMDGTVLNRWTPRLVSLTEELRRLLHPSSN